MYERRMSPPRKVLRVRCASQRTREEITGVFEGNRVGIRPASYAGGNGQSRSRRNDIPKQWTKIAGIVFRGNRQSRNWDPGKWTKP